MYIHSRETVIKKYIYLLLITIKSIFEFVPEFYSGNPLIESIFWPFGSVE